MQPAFYRWVAVCDLLMFTVAPLVDFLDSSGKLSWPHLADIPCSPACLKQVTNSVNGRCLWWR